MRKWLSGRASPCQGEGREFESRLPLQYKADSSESAFLFWVNTVVEDFRTVYVKRIDTAWQVCYDKERGASGVTAPLC